MAEIDLKTIHAGREVVYASFSDIFLYQPRDKHYEILREVIPPLAEMTKGSTNLLMSESIDAMNRFLSSISLLSDDKLADFKLEHLQNYTSLFCLNDDVPIAESYYTSTEKLMMQEARDQVLEIYRKNKFSYEIESNEPEDHIAIELLFLSYLSALLSDENFGNDRYKELLRIHIEFIDTHLLNWIENFISKLTIINISEQFYLPASKFLLGYINEDRAFLQDILDQIKS